jgi:hypothetical protein
MTQEVGSQKLKDRCKCGQNTISLRKSVGRKRPKIWPDMWILNHDSAPAHDVLRVREFLAKKSITKMDYPPYSPDFSCLRFLAVSKIKKCPKGQRFADIPAM